LPAAPLRSTKQARSTEPARWPWAVRWTAPGVASGRVTARPVDTAWAVAGRAAGQAVAASYRAPVRLVARRARVDRAVRLLQARPVPHHWAARRAARATAGRPASQRCRQEVR